MGDPYFIVRVAVPADANSILDIDIKCFETAWTPDEWSRVGFTKGYAVITVTDRGIPVGVAVFQHDQEHKALRIEKVAVKPLHRRMGVARRLLDSTIQLAEKWPVNSLSIVIPESTVYPGPDNLSLWLKASGFEAKEFIKKCFTSYGETEDGVKFTAPIKNRRPQ